MRVKVDEGGGGEGGGGLGEGGSCDSTSAILQTSQQLFQ